ncbi:hypothetical protein F5Y17DRAFT_454178 [Xylariaceae sp. FL0594]|nr:hypothetical protein F5Y17DRAFT_454178 [Xylariaceae sp. FL0594]
MRFSQSPHGVLTLLLLAGLTTFTTAFPYPRDALRDLGFGYLMPDQCSEYCGADNEVCCAADEACYTSSGVPACTAKANALAERDYTTTWTETHTYTSTISSWYVPTTTAGVGSGGADCIPVEGTGQIACGPICCANWQYCAYKGQCLANPGYSTWSEWTTTGVYITTQYSQPWRPTSSGPVATVTSEPTGTFVSATESPSSTNPAEASTTNNSLSPGAIAGIVVGTIAGVVLLLLLCFCCIARGLWHTFVALIGGGKKRRNTERIEIIEERYSRRGSASAAAAAAAAGRPTHRTWFGGAGGRPAGAGPRKEKKKKEGGGGFGWLIAAGAALAILLGLRRGDKRKGGGSHRPSSNSWSSSFRKLRSENSALETVARVSTVEVFERHTLIEAFASMIINNHDG